MKISSDVAVDLLFSFFKKTLAAQLILLCQPLLFAQQTSAFIEQSNYEYLERIFVKVPAVQEATLAFFEASEQLRNFSPNNEKKLTRLHADIIDISSAAELEQWKNLTMAEEKVAFLQRFWLGRDPTPATPANERLVEHYTRLLHAREKYRWLDFRGYDDRGMIYIQYGAPDDKVEDVINSGTGSVASWVYNHFRKPVNFDFIDNGSGYYRLNNRLTDAIVVVRPQSYIDAISDLVRRRVTLHTNYAKLYWDIQEILGQTGRRPTSSNPQQGFHEIRARIDQAFNEAVLQSEKNQALLPKVVTEVFQNIDDLPCVVNLAQFKGADNQPELIAAFGFKKAVLKGQADTIQAVSAIRDTKLAISKSHNLAFRPAEISEEFVAVETYSLPLGKYYYSLDLTNAAGRQRGLQDFTVILGKYPQGILHLSNVIFAKKIIPSSDYLQDHYSFKRHHLVITPYPFTNLKRDKQFFVYFEIYDLQLDASGETFYEIQYEIKAPEKKGLLASLNPFGKSGGSISVSDTRRGKTTTEPTYLQIDFSNLRSGKYNLIVRVTDKVASLTKETKLTFELE
jgi:GWxTD domain-containing protein